MKHIEGKFKGVRSLDLFYQGWLPDGEIKAVLLIVHGLGEHCGRYANHVNALVPLGYAIYSWDLVGHGKSGGGREEVERFTDYTASLNTYYHMVKEWQPGKPIFLFGHSMGSLIACYYLLDHQADFKGAIISAPTLTPGKEITPLTIALGRVLSRLAPKVGVLGLNPGTLSRDPQVVQDYVSDPLVFHGKTPARLGGEMYEAIQVVNAGLKKITLPFIVIHGGDDRLVEPEGAHLLYDRASSSDKTIKIYPGLYHEVHHEPEHAAMFKDLENWLAEAI